MKTLILNGSPHANGDTAVLLNALKEELRGDVVEVNCYRAKISPCTDCHFCQKHPGCAIDDEMQSLYPVIESCDRVIIATPVYFSEPTPPVLSVCSRLQTYFCASFFRKSPVSIAPKKGGIVLVGGGSGSAAPAEATVRRLLRAMKCKEIGPVAASLKTDHVRASEDADAIASAKALAAWLNEGSV